MNRRLVWKSLPFLLITLVINLNELLATHIRAGEIVAVRVSSTTLTYRFSLIAYTDTESKVPFGGGNLDFGDGTDGPLEFFSDSQQEQDLGDMIRYNKWEFTHTFQGPGTYVVRYDERNRNDGVINMSNSVDTPFYIETQIVIDPFLGLNNTPVFLVPPVDKGCVGVAFFHNPGAYDPDGDSLSYHITVPKQSFERDVNNYLDPNDPSFYENFLTGDEDQSNPPEFDIDPATGNLIWDAPGTQGEYNVAFIVREWRRLDGEWFPQGYVTRDMQIVIEDCNNGRPEIIEPPELCVLAGTEVEEFITATDPDGHDVKIEVFGGPFEFPSNTPVLTPTPAFRPSPQTIQFNWQTDCDMVRERPYAFQLKATDDPLSIPNDDIPGPKLTDFKSWNIRIVAPAPTGLTATQEPISADPDVPTRRIRLDWDAYSCGTADSLEIWRRVGEFPFEAAECTVGMPETAGYEMVTLIGNKFVDDGDGMLKSTTTFVDDNNGKGLAPGAVYCYRIVARFPDPTGGESYASNEGCSEVIQTAPIPLNVDITSTDETNGEIYIRWAAPTDLDPVVYPPPYTYMVARGEGFENEDDLDTLGTTNLLEFTDTGLNTYDRVYNYRIRVMNTAGTTTIDTSLPASSVRLEPTPEVGLIGLSWNASTPWSIVSADFPVHQIYRAIDDGFSSKDDLSFELITEVNAGVDGLAYIDDGSTLGTPGELDDETDYCYYVITQGSYGNDEIEEPLINKSQIACARPNDNIAPCAPILTENFDCEQSLSFVSCSWDDYAHNLQWQDDESEGCDDDIRSYEIYYSLDGDESSFELVGSSTFDFFLHERLPSFKGCYKIRAVDRSGNQSEFSNTICLDNCPNIVMPNAFTPNGDGINDVFTPYNDIVQGQPVDGWSDNSQCPRFIESLTFTVFDRTGGDLFNYRSEDFIGEDAKMINWRGVNNAGKELPSGVYYYSLEVIFDRLDPDDGLDKFEGWVQIIR